MSMRIRGCFQDLWDHVNTSDIQEATRGGSEENGFRRLTALQKQSDERPRECSDGSQELGADRFVFPVSKI